MNRHDYISGKTKTDIVWKKCNDCDESFKEGELRLVLANWVCAGCYDTRVLQDNEDDYNDDDYDYDEENEEDE